VYDYLRLLWARVGHPFCPECNREIVPQTVQSVTDTLLALPDDTPLLITFPLAVPQPTSAKFVAERLRSQGFMRLLDSTGLIHVDDLEKRWSSAVPGGELLVVADRISLSRQSGGRIAEAVAVTFREGGGDCIVERSVGGDGPRHLPGAAPSGAGEATPERIRFTERYECAWDGTRVSAPVPTLFSFNSPRGACATCNGFGANLEYDEKLIVRDPRLSLSEGALDPWTKPRYGNKRRALANFAKANGIGTDIPWQQITAEKRELLLNARSRGYKGIFPFLRDLESKRYKQYIRVFLRQYQIAQTCTSCAGSRLNTEALLVRVAGRTIADVVRLPVNDLRSWLDGLALSGNDFEISRHILREARSRVRFLCDVGLEYLSLDRTTRTLSGGEAQRIALANCIGSQLVDTLYVLDELFQLHQRLPIAQADLVIG
jgi:excinuclease ABC subunit A